MREIARVQNKSGEGKQPVVSVLFGRAVACAALTGRTLVHAEPKSRFEGHSPSCILIEVFICRNARGNADGGVRYYPETI
jgi:hypothetical protein